MADVPELLQKLLEAQSKSQKDLIEALTTRMNQLENTLSKERLIDRFPAMKESDSVDLYIQSFENEMSQLEVSHDSWKALITVRFPTKLKGYLRIATGP